MNSFFGLLASFFFFPWLFLTLSQCRTEALEVACVAWRFCWAGRRSGVAARKIKLLPPQSPRGFSALARLYYLARPTKTAMLRRLPWKSWKGLIMRLEISRNIKFEVMGEPPPGGYFRNFGVGMCRWDPGTLAFTRARSSEFCYPRLD